MLEPSRARTIAKRVLLAALLALVALGLFFFYGLWRFGNFLRTMPVPSGATKALADGIREQVEVLNEGRGQLRWLRADMSSVGFPDREKRLTDLSYQVALFVGTFRRPPATLYELLELFQPWPASRSREAERWYAGFAHDCNIYTFPDDSYVLNCDDWKPDGLKSFLDLEDSFEKGIERFYRRADHVLLYVPNKAQAEAYAEKHPAHVELGAHGHP